MMDEEIRNLPSARKWRKYIKRGADDFWDSHGIFTYIDQVHIFPFLAILFSSPPNSLTPITSDYLLFFMTLLLLLPSFSSFALALLNLFVASCISLC